ncbi:hypothetical protein KIF59_03980 [Enterobacter cloacae subsp. cloacae]|nr:hypothetical protein [Enterobacter cloacae subsp. cloacae]
MALLSAWMMYRDFTRYNLHTRKKKSPPLVMNGAAGEKHLGSRENMPPGCAYQIEGLKNPQKATAPSQR